MQPGAQTLCEGKGVRGYIYFFLRVSRFVILNKRAGVFYRGFKPQGDSLVILYLMKHDLRVY